MVPDGHGLLMAMGTGDYFGVFNDSFARFHFQVKPLAVVLTFEFPRSSVHGGSIHNWSCDSKARISFENSR